MADQFPDLQHVEAIRRSLWSDGGLGRAAVMVGAGFSLNAEPVRPGRIRMPNWADLIRLMVDRLYPAASGDHRNRERMLRQIDATSTAVRVAEEFAATFGRPALDDLIFQAIPDADFAPGVLHNLLLDLPWVDVLTTNYDTLLESAARTCIYRQYSVVRTPEEISISARPRIVKLHGSFPSTRPFVLTEEDFRTYPRRFAPFLNLAQQVAMENVLCLIGFSGDDANFLYWTGWVRDHLGPYAPKIYLCGLLKLPDSQRMLLHGRNVVPIDFSPQFSDARYEALDPSTRHRYAIEWFLRSLAIRPTYNPMEWPLPQPESSPFSHLPELLAMPAAPLPKKERWHPEQQPVTKRNQNGTNKQQGTS